MAHMQTLQAKAADSLQDSMGPKDVQSSVYPVPGTEKGSEGSEPSFSCTASDSPRSLQQQQFACLREAASSASGVAPEDGVQRADL